MKVYKNIYIILILLLSVFSVKAQEIFQVDNYFKSKDFKDNIIVFNTLDSINPNILIDNDTIDWKRNKTSYGFSNNFFWLKFKIQNIGDKRNNLYLVLARKHKFL